MTIPHHLRRPRRDATVPPPPAESCPEAPRVRTAYLARLECEIARREAEGTLVPGHDGKEPTGIDAERVDATIQNQEGLMRTMTPAQRAKKNARDRERRAEEKAGRSIQKARKAVAIMAKRGSILTKDEASRIKKAMAPYSGGTAKVKKASKIIAFDTPPKGSTRKILRKLEAKKVKPKARGHGVGRGPSDAVQTCINIPRKLRNAIDAEAAKNAKRGEGADSRSALVLEQLGKRWA